MTKCVFLCVLFGSSTCLAEDERNWKIGGKIHFEEHSGINFIGIVKVNSITREILHEIFDIKNDICAENAKVLVKQENGSFFIRHYEERSRPGIGEELHATLLYTSRRVESGHETLKDICTNLAQVEKTLSCVEAPSLEQVANTYQKIIKPEWKFEISDVVFWTSQVSNLIVAKLSFNGRDEIVNAEGNPVSGSALHMTLVNLDTSVASEKDKIEQIVSKLKEKLIGKMIKIGERNGQADLEFGVSGSANRIRPCQSAQEIFSKSYANEINEGFVSVKDGKLFYRVVGKGLPLIVLHGGPGALSQDYLLPQLYKLAENNLVVFYDQRGSGRSLETKLDEKHINIDQFVEDLETLRISLGFDKFILMGHSWGGLLAMEYAVGHQDNLMGLILLNTAPADSKGQKAFVDVFGLRTKNIYKDIEPLFAYEDFKKLDTHQISDLYRKLFSVYFYKPEEVNHLSLNFSIASAQSGFKVMEEISKTYWLQPGINLFPKLKKLAIPVFILHGKQDIIPICTAQEIKDAIPQSEIIELDHCNHFPYIEQPFQFFNELNQFLSKIKQKELLNGYVEMSFQDSSSEPPSPHDSAMEKKL